MVSGPVRLVLLHHAGGSRLLFRGWRQWLPAGWEVLALDLPGRGFHHRLPALDELAALADFVGERALDRLDRPLALFGHSLGAAIAAELTNRLLAGAGPAPVWLGVSGWDARRAAGVVPPSGDELRARLIASGGAPAALLADTTLWRMVEPLLRKDLAAIGGYRPEADRSWLGVALSLFGGRDDPGVSAGRLAELAGGAPRLVGLHLYPGDHFYLTGRAAELSRQIVTDVRSVLAATSSMKGG